MFMSPPLRETEQQWYAWQGCREEATALQKEHCLQFAKDHLNKSEDCWKNLSVDVQTTLSNIKM